MAHLVLYVAPAVVVAACLLIVVAVRRRRRAAAADDAPSAPRSLVRILDTEDDLRSAVVRAAEFERMVTNTLASRARRYEEMIPSATVTMLSQTSPALPTVDEDTPRAV